MRDMEAIYLALRAAIWSKDSAVTWGVVWPTFGVSVASAREWLGLLAILAGLVFTILRAYREWLLIQQARRDGRQSSTSSGTGGTFGVVLVAGLLAMSTTGCGLMPKRVEYFQREVQAVPKKPDALVESEKQAAELTARLAWSAQVAAHAEQASTNVINPLDNLAVVSRAVSSSLGPPTSKWSGEPGVLADRLDTRNAKLDARVEDYRDSVARDVGKKIEGTGLFQIPWLINAGLWIGIPLLLLWVVRIALNIWNPAVGVIAGQVERMTVGTLKRAATQTWSGIESFKAKIDALDLDDKVKAMVKGVLREKLVDHQDTDVQQVIQRLTAKPPE